MANNFDVIVKDRINERAAWTCKMPGEAARNSANHVAYWRGVEVTA